MATLSLCASMSSLAVSRPKATLSCKSPAKGMTMKAALAAPTPFRVVALRTPTTHGRGALVVVAGGNSIGNTLHGTRRARARTSGFRARLQSPTGRRVLKARRAKGRKYLAPAGAVNGWNREKKKSLK